MDAELFKRMEEAAERFRSGESDFEEIMTPIGPAHLVRDESDPRGFRLDFVGGASGVVPTQQYPASPSRPPGYPAPLPFLANCAAVVDTGDQSVSWQDPPDGALEQLVTESVDDGWVTLGSSGAIDQPSHVLQRRVSSARSCSRAMPGVRVSSCGSDAWRSRRSRGRLRDVFPCTQEP